MSTSTKTPAADRSHGGPGSSHETAERNQHRDKPAPGEPTNSRVSHVSGGGGERDRHHVHDPKDK